MTRTIIGHELNWCWKRRRARRFGQPNRISCYSGTRNMACHDGTRAHRSNASSCKCDTATACVPNIWSTDLLTNESRWKSSLEARKTRETESPTRVLKQKNSSIILETKCQMKLIIALINCSFRTLRKSYKFTACLRFSYSLQSTRRISPSLIKYSTSVYSDKNFFVTIIIKDKNLGKIEGKTSDEFGTTQWPINFSIPLGCCNWSAYLNLRFTRCESF